MKIFSFESSLLLSTPRNQVFEFFSDASNLESITPPWLRFRIVSAPPTPMHKGAEIEYRLRIHGFPVTWRSRITDWEPPGRFVDEQVRGPYRRWVHEHKFIEHGGGTICEDHVEYSVLGGTIIDRIFIRRDIRNIFDYRSERLKMLFPLPPASHLP